MKRLLGYSLSEVRAASLVVWYPIVSIGRLIETDEPMVLHCWRTWGALQVGIRRSSNAFPEISAVAWKYSHAETWGTHAARWSHGKLWGIDRLARIRRCFTIIHEYGMWGRTTFKNNFFSRVCGMEWIWSATSSGKEVFKPEAWSSVYPRRFSIKAGSHSCHKEHALRDVAWTPTQASGELYEHRRPHVKIDASSRSNYRRLITTNPTLCSRAPCRHWETKKKIGGVYYGFPVCVNIHPMRLWLQYIWPSTLWTSIYMFLYQSCDLDRHFFRSTPYSKSTKLEGHN